MNNNFNTKKSLGQHFLIDELVIQNIIAATGDLSSKTALEIGPGNLALTSKLVTKAKHVFAIEKDYRLKPKLDDLKTNYSNFNYEIADALTYKDKILGNKVLISNLPYNIGTQIFLNYLQNATINKFDYFILMLQKEVAERITAKPSCRAYGRLSIISQLLSNIEVLFEVDKHCFKPAPKVQSLVIKVTPLVKPMFFVDINKLSSITKLAFQGKRKTIKNSLKILNLNWEHLGINPTVRAEELSVEDFCNIANNSNL